MDNIKTNIKSAELNYKDEVESLIKVKTDEELKLEFADEYQKLCKKYGMSFMQGNISIVKVNFPKD